MKRPMRRFRVWTGTVWCDTCAVTEAKAISNVAWRMRKLGKFPVLSQFEAKAVDDGGSVSRV